MVMIEDIQVSILINLKTLVWCRDRDNYWFKAAFPKLWSADHKWSSDSALVVLLD